MCEEHIRVKNRVGQPYNEATRGNQKTIQWPDVGVTTEPKTFQKKKSGHRIIGESTRLPNDLYRFEFGWPYRVSNLMVEDFLVTKVDIGSSPV